MEENFLTFQARIDILHHLLPVLPNLDHGCAAASRIRRLAFVNGARAATLACRWRA
jgi:hypothetical protein